MRPIVQRNVVFSRLGRPDLPCWPVLIVALGVFLLSGCSTRSPKDAQGGSEATTRGQGSAAANRSHPLAGDFSAENATERPRRSTVATYSARSGFSRGNTGVLTSAEALQRVLAIVQDSVEFAPTLVVWLIDISPSAMQWGSELHSDVRQFYADVAPQLLAQQADRLQSAVLTISRRVEQPVQLSSDPADVVRAMDALRREESGREVTFQAVRQALKLYVPVRREGRREVMLIIITDEAGDDWKLVDELVEQPRKYAIPVYVVGVPAPFGRLAALDAGVESSDTERAVERGEEGDTPAAPWQPILQGPESRNLERIALKFERLDLDGDLLDSGFGPFALERLCRESGGALLAVRRADTQSFSFTARRRSWPTSDVTSYDPQVMRRYLPDAVDEAGYQTLLASNRACLALHQAAELPEADVLRDPELHFVKRDEADLKNRLDKAQRDGGQGGAGRGPVARRTPRRSGRCRPTD